MTASRKSVCSWTQRRWGRRSEKYLFGSLVGQDESRFATLDDGTPYDSIFIFDDMGYNFEPSEIMAAYGLVQLERLQGFNAARQQNFARFNEVLAHHGDKVLPPRTTPEVETTWMRFPIVLADGIDRSAMQEFFLARGIPTRMVWTGNILRQPGFRNIERRVHGTMEGADTIMNRTFFVGVFPGLSPEAIQYVIEQFHGFFGKT